MFSLPILAALAVVAVVTSFISGIFGMAGGMLLIGFLLAVLPVPVAMVFHGIIQIAANAWRAWLWRHHVRWSVVFQFGSGAATALLFFSFLDFVPDKALVLMAVGLTTLLFTHTLMNVGMTIGVTPITGLPLPLVSYGGSFLLTVLFSIGILQSIWVHRGGSSSGRERWID